MRMGFDIGTPSTPAKPIAVKISESQLRMLLVHEAEQLVAHCRGGTRESILHQQEAVGRLIRLMRK